MLHVSSACIKSSYSLCTSGKGGNATRLLEVFLGVGVHEELVKFVGDAAAVLDGRHHVSHRLPSGCARALRLHLQQVILRATFE